MATRATSLRLDADLWDRVTARARELGQSNTMFVARALESALSGTPGGVGKPGAVDLSATVEPTSASSRAPVEKATPAQVRQAALNKAKGL